MKYIRTKDGVYEVVGFDEECIIPSPLIKVRKDCCIERITHCCKEDIIKQADTIEELCDAYVVICDYEPSIINAKYVTFEEALKYSNYEEEKENMQFFGAIWCERGLIYVAKMNDKGDLELI